MPWRRFVTIPGFTLGLVAWLMAAPIWLPMAAAVDLVRGNRGVALRSAGVVTVYLSCETIGIIASGGVWIWRFTGRLDAEQWDDIHYRLEAWWGATLFRAVVRLFGMRVVVEGENDASLERGPYVLLPRHSSTGDTLLASALISRPHGLRLRYVLKRENLWDPCLDIVGNRLPNVFIDRFSADSASETSKIREIARDLGPRDGVLVYPEGTRFSSVKRDRVLASLQEKGETKLLDYANSLSRVLPPRPGGTLGVLDAAPEADVVFCAHTGFEGAASITQIWQGALIGRVIRVHFRRVPRAAIPRTREELIAWLLTEWQRVGDWVEREQSLDPGLTRSEEARSV
jgi:1-acyl-sn-glycerol-3-phosphate acyltransferase